MKKIPSVFLRNEGHQIVDRVNPECQWVLDGLGFATEKFDGSACLIRGGLLYRRLRVKPGTLKPPGWLHHSGDLEQLTGHGWGPICFEPARYRPEEAAHREAKRWHMEQHHSTRHAGTYELVGPSVRRNPYRLRVHQLWRHGSTVIKENETLTLTGRTFAGLKHLLEFELYPMEGIVFWCPARELDGVFSMAKIKRRDFGLAWPVGQRTGNERFKHPAEEH